MWPVYQSWYWLQSLVRTQFCVFSFIFGKVQWGLGQKMISCYEGHYTKVNSKHSEIEERRTPQRTFSRRGVHTEWKQGCCHLGRKQLQQWSWFKSAIFCCTRAQRFCLQPNGRSNPQRHHFKSNRPWATISQLSNLFNGRSVMLHVTWAQATNRHKKQKRGWSEPCI
jgi:hypothetical protein